MTAPRLCATCYENGHAYESGPAHEHESDKDGYRHCVVGGSWVCGNRSPRTIYPSDKAASPSSRIRLHRPTHLTVWQECQREERCATWEHVTATLDEPLTKDRPDRYHCRFNDPPGIFTAHRRKNDKPPEPEKPEEVWLHEIHSGDTRLENCLGPKYCVECRDGVPRDRFHDADQCEREREMDQEALAFYRQKFGEMPLPRPPDFEPNS